MGKVTATFDMEGPACFELGPVVSGAVSPGEHELRAVSLSRIL